MPNDNVRIAVLIDADNTSPRHVTALVEEVATFGSATVKRAYGDWTTSQLGGWKSRLNQHAIQPMQQFAYTTGKNSTDSALIIDAMDLLYSGNVDAFALVSSDSDFTRLATRLRESGMTVLGFGLRKTPQSLVSACDRFVYLELLEAGTAHAADAPDAEVDAGDDAGQAPARQPDLQRLLTNAVNAASHDDGWASLSAVGSQISRSNPSFDVRAYGESKLVNLVRAQTYLEVEQQESGGVRVRLRSKRPARKTSKSTTSSTPAKTTKTAKSTKPAQAAAVETSEPALEPEPDAEVKPEPAAPKVTTRTRTRKAAQPAPPVD